MQTDSVEKAAGVGAIGLWAAMHGWLGWLVVLYAACMMLDCLTGTAQAIKNGEWSSHKARQGLWHKGGSIIMVFVSVLTDILLGLTLNHISGLTLPFNYANRPVLVHCIRIGEYSGKRRKDGSIDSSITKKRY